VDRDHLRRILRRTDAPRTLVLPRRERDVEERLWHAEEMLVKCGAEPSADQRRVLVVTAVNHLCQVLARDLPGKPDWWTVELDDRLTDLITTARLRLDVAVARLAVGNVAGVRMPIDELIDMVTRFRDETMRLDADDRLRRLVRGFVELVTAHLAPIAESVVNQLLVAVARRRVRAQVGFDLDAAMSALELLVFLLGQDSEHAPVHDLYRMLDRLPDGSERSIVYRDLLPLLPTQLRWHQQQKERLPGALVEVAGEPAVSHLLRNCAGRLEWDLRRARFQSDRGLIGQAAHVFQQLAEQGADRDVISRSDQTRAELINLAKMPVWPTLLTRDSVGMA